MHVVLIIRDCHCIRLPINSLKSRENGCSKIGHVMIGIQFSLKLSSKQC